MPHCVSTQMQMKSSAYIACVQTFCVCERVIEKCQEHEHVLKKKGRKKKKSVRSTSICFMFV